jgi:hypothetical protein
MSGSGTGTPATSAGYTDLATVRAELRITETTDDDLLARYITLAQRIIDAPRPLGTGRTFLAAADTTKYFDAPWDLGDINDPDSPGLLLDLRNRDLCAITSITNGDGVVIPSSAYVTEPRDTTPYYAIRLKRGGAYIWTWSGDNPEEAIAIVGRWAYSATPSADIQQLALRLVVWLYKARDDAGFDHDIRTEDGLTILGAKMPRDIRLTIETYWSLV